MFKPWRSPAFRVQAIALLVAAFAMTAMLILRDSVDQRFNQRTAVALGADWILEGTRFPEPSQQQAVADLRHAQAVSFSSVLINNDQFLLASIRALSEDFPLYGELSVSDSRFSEPYPIGHGPKSGTVWLAGQALDRLGLKTGEFITLGERSFLITKVLVQEPDQQAGFYSMNPRALIHLADLESTAVLGPGSRYRHHLLVAADDAQRTVLDKQLSDTLRSDQSIETVGTTELRSQGPVEQMFLWSQLAVMLVVLLCAAAIYLTASHRARQQQTLCAVMKTVGARQQQIVRRLLGGDVLALLLPILAGVGLAVLVGWQLAALLGADGLFVTPVVWGLVGPVLLWLGFAAPTLWVSLSLPATALLSGREAPARLGRRVLLIAILTPIPLAAIMTGSLAALWPLLLLTLAVSLGLPIILWPLVMLMDRFSARLGLAGRLALRRLSRRKAATLPLLAALIISLSVLSLSVQTGRELLGDWRATLPEQAPNYFVINLFDQDIDDFKNWLTDHNSEAQPLYPVVRARLTEINDQPVRDAVTKEQDRAERALNRDLSLTQAARLPESNKLTDGRWATGQDEVTVETKLAESLGLELGDSLTFTGPGPAINATVVGLREVDWESFAPNFYFIFSPDTLKAQSRTWITSFFLPQVQQAELGGLVQKFPQISLLDVNAILATLQDIIGQASRAAFVVGVLLLLAALLVLMAALLAMTDTLRRDNHLLVVIGGRRALLRKTAALQAFYLFGGAALLANLIHLAALIPLGMRLFDSQLPLSPWLLLPWSIAALVTLAALLAPPLMPKASATSH
ncbi:MAG: ABC transporter permease [Alcanivorax borkumensis]|uniref:ABC transporter, permease protein, putative n=1 Tax=Alcanivorax borkumensis (strain ATCC 700651 / DSM 11573 / NCIMB 13689 / SK2) TaxID=393595 RepID=Q0VPP8_ALCBS|nr:MULTISPECIES: FtsX-like permease family protein [Alcanivorax]OJH08927.1 MAG: ABC transporter permease [Alcanivorax borkumensis]BAP14300.1 ABC transporter permease protein [Alcanivorax sp. NBRC 101098]CAL16850.1 ABC transporter, permease protein, putative [Alcanivorax borkumensis SK2]